MISPEAFLSFVKIGAALTLLGNIGMLTVFGKRIGERVREVTGRAPARSSPNVIGTDGKPITLDAASRASIQAALTALEQRRKS